MKPGAALIVLLPLVIWGIFLDIAHVANGGSIDLRNRVTGARIAAAGIDPYTYKWARNDPETFCDLRNEPLGLLSKTTVTPWLLAAHAPFNSFPYRSLQWLWFLSQYFLLALGIFVWARHREPNLTRFGMVLVCLFCLSPAWRQHIDHGQVYVLFTALFLVLHAMSGSTSRWRQVGAGVLGAFILGFRPPFLPLLPTLFLDSRRWMFAGLLAGGMIAFATPLFLFGSEIWIRYREAMSVHAELYLAGYQITPRAQSYPSTIENIALDTLARYERSIPFADTSIYKMISFQLKPGWLLGAWLVVAAGTLAWLGWVKKADRAVLWWVASALIFCGDFLLPAYRHTYNDVLALPVILLGMIALSQNPYGRYWTIASASVLLLMAVGWFTPKWALPVPSLLMAVLSAAGILFALFLSSREMPRGLSQSSPRTIPKRS